MTFNLTNETAWCPGCGNPSIRLALKNALEELEIPLSGVMIAAGIGQAGKMPQYIDTNAFAGLHGRAFPAGIGMKLANHHMKVIVEGGDGDGYGEGGNHMIHGIRRNIDITQLVHDNQVYGLTKGQASPTTPHGQKAAMSYEGNRNNPVRPLALALTMGAGFVARGFSGDIEQLTEILKAAISFRGYALVDILQPCPSFNKINTFQWYKDKVEPIPEDHDPTDFEKAYRLAMEWDERIPTGVLYSVEKPIYEDDIKWLGENEPLVERKLDPTDAQELMDHFK